MNIKKVKTVLLACTLLLFFTYSALGQSQNRQSRKKPPTFMDLFKEMDANEDGKLSKEEIKGPLSKNFTKIDVDQDGFISEDEFEKAPKPKRKERDGR